VTPTPDAAATGTAVSTGTEDASGTAETSPTVTPFLVVIDAGHQAHANNALEPVGPGSKKKRPKVTSGTSGVVTHAHESAINLRVALQLRDALVAAGVDVIMVRTIQKVDIPNSGRAKIANAAHADLLLRIHCDGAARSVHGFLTLVPARNTWTRPISKASARAGADIQAASLAATGARDRGIDRRGDLSGFNWSQVPAVLVEMGNMKNAKEDRKLSAKAYEAKLVSGMVAGVQAFAAGR
jgi:N-acetylmuramoyl-L-alanine amidase